MSPFDAALTAHLSLREYDASRSRTCMGITRPDISNLSDLSVRQPANDPAPAMLTLDDVLNRLRGRAGRTKVLAHIDRLRGGKPAVRIRLLFTEADFNNILESLRTCQNMKESNSSNAPAQSAGISAAMSVGSTSTKAQALLTKMLRK